MIITLDDQSMQDPVPANTTLQTLIEQVRAANPDRLIVSVAFNGQILGDAELTEALPRPIADDTQIDMQTGDARDLIRDALIGLANGCDEARQRQAEVADKLAAGETAGAVSSLSQDIGLWQTAQRVLGECGTLIGEDLGQRQFDGKTVVTWFEELAERLSELRDALESHDMVLLADLVRYEMPGLCETWQKLFTDLSEQVTRPTPA